MSNELYLKINVGANILIPEGVADAMKEDLDKANERAETHLKEFKEDFLRIFGCEEEDLETMQAYLVEEEG